MENKIKNLHVSLSEAEYDINIGRNILNDVDKYFDLDRDYEEIMSA